MRAGNVPAPWFKSQQANNYSSNFRFLRKFSAGMSLTRSLTILRSLSHMLPLPRYFMFFSYERLSSSSGGAVEPQPQDWVMLLEEEFKRKFDDFRCEFKELRDKVNSIQTMQPMGLGFTPGKKQNLTTVGNIQSADWVMLHEEEFDKQFEKFLSDYKKFKDKSVQITASELKSGMQPVVLRSDVDEPPPPPDLEWKKLKKQFGGLQHELKKFNERTDKILNIVSEIMSLFWFMSFDNRNTTDIMKKVKNLTNVLKGLYRKLGKPIPKHTPGYYWWRFTTQKVISVLAFVHWMETGSLLLQRTVEEKLGFEPPEFDLDLDDYLFGLCFMSDDLTVHANSLYNAGNHDSIPNIATFMINLEETLGVLFLSNNKLHEGFEGLKDNVKMVQDMVSAAGF